MGDGGTVAAIGLVKRVRIISGLAKTTVRASIRRLAKGKTHPEWSFSQELMRAYMRYFVSISPQATVPQMRRFLQSVNRWNVTPKGLFIEFEKISGVVCEHVFGEGLNGPLLLYFHGGGYNVCSTATHRAMVCWLCQQASIECYSVDYRLAPEHPFPAAVEDAVKVFRRLVDAGHSPNTIVFAGDSAGGGLAIAAAIALRDAGEPLPAAIVGLSPWVNLRCDGDSFKRNASYDYLSAREGLQMAQNYAGGKPLHLPLISPLFADLSGLPPMFLQAGGLEVLHDDIVTFARRAREAGTEVTLEVYPGMVHVWHMFFGVLPAARDALTQIARFIEHAADAQMVAPERVRKQ